MIFEIHITVDSYDIEQFKKTCGALGVSPLWIQNSRGIYSRQMLSAYSCDLTTTLEEAEIIMSITSQKFERGGFKVIREKIECPVGKSPVPGVYHECHIKIALPETETDRVLNFCNIHSLSPSWSLIHNVPNERKWYLTVRDYTSTPENAKIKFIKATHAVRAEFGKTGKIEMETAIIDTNKDLDKGWA